MPRDLVNEEMELASPQVTQPVTDDVLRVLIEAREWLSDRAHWHKGDFSERGLEGLATAKSVCVWGACIKGAGMEHRPAVHDAMGALGTALGACIGDVIRYNDHPDTTHADILALFDRAIAARKAGL